MKKVLESLILAPLAALALVGCAKEQTTNPDDGGTSNGANETTPLIFSSEEVDGVFNPFYSSTSADSTIVGMTQLSLIGNDKNGQPICGDDEAVVAYDYDVVTTGTGSNQKTTYYFVLKNNVRFSDGSLLTIRDVLFNLYEYLDPAYTGSTTIYSTDIVGLQEYRTQESDENEQDDFKKRFENNAQTRIQNLLYAYYEVVDDEISPNFTIDEFREALKETSFYNDGSEEGLELIADYDKALELFEEELNSDYSNSVDTYSDFTLEGENGNVIKPFTTDVEMFLYNEGYLTFDKNGNDGNGELSFTWGSPEDAKDYSKEQAIEAIYNDIVPNQLDQVIQYWATATDLFTYLTNVEMEKYFSSLDTDLEFPNISGIKFANKDTVVTVNGEEYDKVEYEEDGITPKEGYNEVLSIEINGVDPKAIWNFAFAVAPMYYYSSNNYKGKNFIDSFDFESNFGVEYNSQSFQEDVIKDSNKIGVPVGAGAYMASKASGGTYNVTSGDFLENNVIYFERNPYFVMGKPIINKIRYTVVSTTQMINSLSTGAIDYVTPNSTTDNKEELESLKEQGKQINYKTVQSLGYGYIGVNATYVPTLEVRQAIMHAIDTSLTVNYYGGSAKPIYRSMSLSSWAYPQGATAYYPFIGGRIPSDLSVVNPLYADFVEEKGKSAGDTFTEAEQIEFIKSLVESAGYSIGGDGVYRDSNGNVLRYTFTIAGSETEHPAFSAFNKAATLLNKCGFDVEAKNDANALKKLNNGSLAVWAAAWSSTIDPDMYQVYHKDSTAGSVKNWGYNTILANTGGRFDRENSILDDLSEKIEEARETNVQSERALIYSNALDLVMQLAVELPCYQRDDLFAYNTAKLDESSLLSDDEVSSFISYTNKIWNIRLNEAQ